MIRTHQPLHPHEVQNMAGFPISVITYQPLDELGHIEEARTMDGALRTLLPSQDIRILPPRDPDFQIEIRPSAGEYTGISHVLS